MDTTEKDIRNLFANNGQLDRDEVATLLLQLVERIQNLERAPQRTWVGLTDEEIVDAYDVARVSFKRSQQGIRGQMLTSRDSPDWHYAKAIEAKLKEKNT